MRQNTEVEDSRARLDINRNIAYHAPTEDQTVRYQRLRCTMKDLAHLIVDLVPPGRERSLAMTKLEETGFWANAGIAREGK